LINREINHDTVMYGQLWPRFPFSEVRGEVPLPCIPVPAFLGVAQMKVNYQQIM